MNVTALFPSQSGQQKPILIVDKISKIGEGIVKQIKNETLIVYVSEKTPLNLQNVIHIPFDKKVPTIPDNHYSHIFLIDENLEVSNHVLDAFFKKAQYDNSFLVLCISLHSAKDQFIRNYISNYSKAKIAIVGDIFQKDEIYDHKTEINKFISSVKTIGGIKISGDGTREVAPIFYDDVVLGILETVFGNYENNRIFYVFPKHKITLLTLAHIFQKINPEIKIDFTSQPNAPQESYIPSNEGVFILGESYKIEDKIKKIEFEKINTNVIDKEVEYKEKPKLHFNYSYASVLIFLLLLLPLISTILFYAIGAVGLYSLKNSIEKGDLPSAKTYSRVASKSFNIAKESSTVLISEASMVGQEGRVSELIEKIDSGSDISYAASSLIDAAYNIKEFLGQSKTPNTDFYLATSKFKNALFIYNKEKQTGLFPQSIVSKLTDPINFATSTIDFWPDLLGFNGPKTYLVLLQNNMELRPGGGFIGSYGILSLDKGKTGFKIYDVYDADGQLKDHYEPPFPIRRYLSSMHLFLRDSNFDTDFTKSAISAAVILNKEMKQSVDGVIGVDLLFVKNILSVVGPVKLFDYNETVDADNFFKITQSHTEKDFFAGSTQKKDFLKSFYNAFSLKLSGSKNISYINLIQALAKSIYEKHIVFSFNDANTQANFSVNGWSSSLKDLRQKSDSQVNDFIGISEANLGGNKVNYYISRNLDQKININLSGAITEELTLSINNSAPKRLGSKGIYKNYLRFILPLGSTITKIEIDGEDQKIIDAITDPTVYEKKNFVAPVGLEVYKKDEEQNSVYGLLVTVDQEQLKKISVEYLLPVKINPLSKDIIYNLKVFKQPGVDSFPYTVSLNYGKQFVLVKKDDEIKNSGQEALFSAQVTKDREIEFNLSRQ